jgi:hypothetical protein
MNAPNFTAVLKDIRIQREIEADREAAEREHNEAIFAEQLVDYLMGDGRPFKYGGIVNLLTACEEIMLAKWKEDTGNTDYETAANALRECAKACDLTYGE